jgi:hypothetical protein
MPLLFLWPASAASVACDSVRDIFCYRKLNSRITRGKDCWLGPCWMSRKPEKKGECLVGEGGDGREGSRDPACLRNFAG